MGKKNISDQNQSNYRLLDDGSFVIEDYNQAKSFSSFFPGIAGLNGIPMWAFYVNRNQGIASFGIRNKNYPIMEFYPANTSYALTANLGFRTFIKIKKNSKVEFYEPFRDNSTSTKHKIRQRMFVRFYEVIFEDINETLGLKTLVRYFTIPNEPRAAMARMVEFTNLSAEKLSIEVIDGLPKIIPYWMEQWILKFMGHTAQAWTTVTNLDKAAPFYKLKVEINDSPEVKNLDHGNFYFGFEGAGKKYKKIKPIVDPEIIFKQDLSYSTPANFVLEDNFSVPKKQFGDNKYPSAMGWFKADILPSEKHNVNSVIGYIESEKKLNEFCKKASNIHYFSDKALENQNLINGLLSSVETNSSAKIFDMYCKQTYLDNLLRGGMPIVIPGKSKKTVFYVYSRKHGDLERDYNNFELSPMYFSQGNGNYRDVNQNKRSDVFINPNIEDFNVLSFYNLIQLDGYNPLLIKGQRFHFNALSKIGEQILKKLVKGKHRPMMKEFFKKTFEPGSLLLFLEKNNIGLSVSKEKFLANMLESSNSINSADHCEGFWTDHWTYNIDLLESYLSIYPEKKHEILLEKNEFTFYDNPHYVVPRSDKYVNFNGKIRQFDAVIKSKEKEKLIIGRQSDINTMRTNYGKGSIYRTTLLVKMLCLVLNKFATLDSGGIGIEMEAGKPSWYDALNGLPGVFGSSVPETFELKRNMQFIHDYLSSSSVSPIYEIGVAEEIYEFFHDLEGILKKSSKYSPFSFWDNATSAKEKYRKRTLFGVSGREKNLTLDHVLSFMNMAIKKIDKGLKKAIERKTGLYYTYYTHEAKKIYSK
ncbi:cellobiose phosphorylase [Elusimicrobiota bacterium]